MARKEPKSGRFTFLTMTLPGYDKTKRFCAVPHFYAPLDGPQGTVCYFPQSDVLIRPLPHPKPVKSWYTWHR
jgi:hypothetical protein